MIYNGYFRDREDSKYTVRITTANGNTAKEITLSGTPFVTEMNESDDTIYTPAKYQTATVEAISDDYMFDVYSGKAQDTKVELYKGIDLMWTGYVRPNLYDVGFERRRELIQIECQDALSTLQYFPYKQTDKQVRTFLYIINKVLTRCNAYTTFYVSDNTQLSSTSDSCILGDLYISEQNFFNDANGNDVWTCKDVLEEICQYLGLTAIADKDAVFFVDYDAIKQGNNTYWRYQLGNNYYSTGTKVTVSFTKQIRAKDYSANGATISMDKVYNKATVKADLYDYENVLPDMYDEAINITADKDDTLKSSGNINNGMYGEVVKSQLGDTDNNNMIIMIDRIYNPQKKKYGAYNVVAVKYFNNPYYKFYKYNGTKDVTDSTTTINYTNSKSMHGATIAKFFVKKLDKTYSSWDIMISDLINKRITLDDWMAKNEISNISFSNYIMMLNPDTNHISNADIEKYPYFQTTVTNTTALFGGNNAYLIISGNYYYHYFVDDPYPIPQSEADIREGRYSMDAGQTYLLCRLQWGNLYWNGDSWTSTKSTFKLPYLQDSASEDERRADATMFKDNEICNIVSWRIGTNEKGYAIKAPNTSIVSGLPILTVFKPFDPNYHSSKSGDNKGQHYKHSVVFLKNFEIKAIIGDPTFSDKNDSDTEYSIDIDTDYVKELDAIKFKINTWDNKKPNYSCVAYKDSNGDFQFLDRTYNKSLATEVKGVSFTDSNNIESVSDGTLRQEWWLIYRLYKQYKNQSVVLKMSLRNNNEHYGLYTVHNLDGKQFVVDSIDRDYQNNSQEIKLIEKK